MIFNFATDNLKPLIWRMKNQKTVFTNGCFDILHVGHARYLKEAAALGDLLIVGLNTDESVRNLKGCNRPIVPENERAEMLCHLEVVNAVVLFGEQTPLKLIEALNPQVLVKGGDWSVEDIVGSDIVLKNGGLVKSLSLIEGRSTTNIVDKILKSVE
tara:strand:- start:1802 stop:2272 length:471 start_codon:yes stop_codon:yes gene_type:complete